MNREQKTAVIEAVATQIRDSQAVLAVDYRGLSVPQAAELRRRLGEAGASLRVVKNTLTERAADRAGQEALKELLEGPTAFTFVDGDAALAARAIATFRREHRVLSFKGGTMNGAAITVDELEAIATLPPRDALHGQMVGVLASPVTGLVRGLNQLIQGLAVQLGEIAERGLVGAGDAAEASVVSAPAEGSDGEDAPAQEGAAVEASVEEEAAVEAPAQEGAAVEASGEEEAAVEAPAEEGTSEREASGTAPAENEDDAPSPGDETGPEGAGKER
jgi:large subunit ribosomal protein L10